MNSIRTWVIMMSVMVACIMKAHVTPLSLSSTTAVPTTQTTGNAHLIYDSAKKAHDAAVAYVAQCQSNVHSIQSKCDTLKLKYVRLKDKYEDMYGELKNISNSTQRQKIQAFMLTMNNFGKQAKEGYATCETKLLAQAQIQLQIAQEAEKDTLHRLQKAQLGLTQSIKDSHDTPNNTHSTPILTLTKPNNGEPIKTPTQSQDTHGSDKYRSTLKNNDITDLKFE